MLHLVILRNEGSIHAISMLRFLLSSEWQVAVEGKGVWCYWLIVNNTATTQREGCVRWLPQQPARSAAAQRSLEQPDPALRQAQGDSGNLMAGARPKKNILA